MKNGLLMFPWKSILDNINKNVQSARLSKADMMQCFWLGFQPSGNIWTVQKKQNIRNFPSQLSGSVFFPALHQGGIERVGKRGEHALNKKHVLLVRQITAAYCLEALSYISACPIELLSASCPSATLRTMDHSKL